MLANMLQMPTAQFHRVYFLQKPLLVRCTEKPSAGSPSKMLTLADVKALVRRREPRPARFLRDVDVTKYVDGKRSALNGGDGEVDPDVVWKAFSSGGFSIRLVQPQQWHQASFELCSCLQEHFGHPVGCAAYLTPAGSQGFPPHYDDVEVFVIQLEGSKRWRLYDRPDARTNPAANRTTEFRASELGAPTQELTLRPGDVLYLPRGVVHQALAQRSGHSLHLTFSTYQRHTWRDLLLEDETLPLSKRARAALAALAALPQEAHDAGAHDDALDHDDADVLRPLGLLRTLPLGLLRSQCAGSPRMGWKLCAGAFTPPHVPFWLTSELWEDGKLGRALDALSLRYLQHSLPPVDAPPLSTLAEATTPAAVPPAPVEQPLALDGASRVRLRAPYCARLVDLAHTNGELVAWQVGQGAVPELALFTNVRNARALSGDSSPAFEVLPSLARSVIQLLEAGCRGVRLGRLEAAADGERAGDLFELVGSLLEHGVLVRQAKGEGEEEGGEEGEEQGEEHGEDEGEDEGEEGEEEEEEEEEEGEEEGEEDGVPELTVDEDGRTTSGDGEGCDEDESEHPQMDFSTRVWRAIVPDHAIPTLVRDCTAAYLKVKAHTRRLGVPYETNATYWVGAHTKPTSALEKLVLDIFRHHTAGQRFDAQRSGAEWWTQVVESSRDIGFHFDRDYELHHEEGVCVHPHLATVTYLSAEGGAPTVVLPVASPLMAADVAGACSGPVRSAHACYPQPGWHLAFDGRLLHGAPAALAARPRLSGSKRARNSEREGRTAHAAGEGAVVTARAETGVGAAEGTAEASPPRVTLLVNIWLHWLPLGADPVHTEVAERLSTRSVPLSWDQLVAPSEQLVRAGGPDETWKLSGFGRDAKTEGLLRLSLPGAEHWPESAGVADQPPPHNAGEPRGGFFALRWPKRRGCVLEHVAATVGT